MNTPVTCFTALISIAEEEQCEELESYLRSKGSSIVTSNDFELLPRLQAIIKECSVVFNQKDIAQQELEGFFYSVVSLFHVVSFEEAKGVLETFCSKIVEEGTTENAEWRLKLLGLMFCHFSEKDPLRYTTLCHRVKLAGKTGLTGSMVLDIDQLCRWVELWQVTLSQRQHLFELLWEAYKNSDKVKLCVRLLKELVRTFTEEDAERGKPYAEALIVHIVSDPSSFVLEDLLSFPSVKALEGEKIHDLLKVFVHDNLLTFEVFYTENNDFMDRHGFVYDRCVTKMRQLTLSSMAVDKDVISLSSLREELKLGPDELEDFIIDCISLKLVEARINQVKQTLVIMTSIHRTFDKSQWQFVHDRLCLWQESIQALKANLKTIKA